MLQLSRADSSPESSPDFNPLDAFEQEIAEDPAELNEFVSTARAPSPVPAAPDPHRLEVAEAEILKLHSQVATLVGVIDDIARQLRAADRTEVARAERQVRATTLRAMPTKRPVPKIMRGAPLVGVIAGLTLGIMTWRFLTTVEVPDSPPIVFEPEPIHPLARPQVMAPLPPPGPAPFKAAAVVTQVQNRVVTPVQNSPAPPLERRLYVGSLSIDATPGGEVFLNRKRAGVTPVRLDNLRAGSHLVWIERDGYRRWTKVVQVSADRLSRVFADLETIDGR
jgi:hypothetical protein